MQPRHAGTARDVPLATQQGIQALDVPGATAAYYQLTSAHLTAAAVVVVVLMLMMFITDHCSNFDLTTTDHQLTSAHLMMDLSHHEVDCYKLMVCCGRVSYDNDL